MITPRRSAERGHFDFGWLDTYHTFSFGDYFDKRFMGFRALRVINEDRVAPGQGFPTHPHRDMEIITVILEGSLQHKDNMGNGTVIRPGEVQRMTAGTGVTHSEFNPDPKRPVHLLQIWILPEKPGLTPGYEQKAFDVSGKPVLIASRDGREGSVRVHQDVSLYAATLAKDASALLTLADEGRAAWLQVARGSITVSGVKLDAGDGAAFEEESAIKIHAAEASEVLFFDLA
jgi:hypothetical protein